jgi:radical SAM superfamily enzyme YgiQ (UPF0313 family)
MRNTSHWGEGEVLRRSKRRILIVCTRFRFDRLQEPRREPLQPMAGVHIASQIDESKYDVDLYHEDWHGAFDTTRPRHYDIVFLSGLQFEFDRMRQLSYFFRRGRALVVAGGSICTLFPEFAAQFFDVVCVGGVDCVTEVIADYEKARIKPVYYSPQSRITNYAIKHGAYYRAGIGGPLHLIESSRGCNFTCDFCVLPAEKANHTAYAIDHVAAAIEDSIALAPRNSIRSRWPALWFIDNNFSQNRGHALAVCDYLKSNTRVKGWGALVTQNTLRDHDFIVRLADAKCRVLFTGIESLSPEFLKLHNKKQNLSKSFDPKKDIEFVERAGISINYPYLFDPRISTAAEMHEQIAVLVRQTDFPLPTFLSFVSPLAGTSLFWDAAAKGELLPNLTLRDLDGGTVAYRNLVDTPENLARFAEAIFTHPATLISRTRVLWSTLHRALRAKVADPGHLWALTASNLNLITSAWVHRRAPQRSYMGGDTQLDVQYSSFAADISPSDFERYFAPIRVTNAKGEPADWIAPYAPRKLTGDRPAPLEIGASTS